jgi:arylsulfatase A-like enzyme
VARSPSSTGLTRRQLIGAAGTAAAGAGLVGAAGCSSGSSEASDDANVLLLIVDSVRSDFVASYGAAQVQTPNMDRLANQGIRFTRFFPEAMPTVPARRTILTGRRVFPFRDWERAPDLGRGPGAAPIEDLSQLFIAPLKKAGYWTASVSDNPFLGFTRSFKPYRLSYDRYVTVVGHSGSVNDPSTTTDAQLRRWLPDGLRNDERFRKGMRKYLANTGYGEDDSKSNSARVFREAEKLLKDAKENQPFAMVVDSFDPHEPWSPTREYIDLYGDPSYTGPSPGTARYARWENYLDLDELRQMRAVYSAALTITDKWLGQFLDAFESAGLADNTAIVLVSDHGLLLGDRGWTGKIAQELHPELIQVPCVIIHPTGRAAGSASPYFASTHDIAPTLLGMAGVPPPPGMDGVDLSPLFDGEEPERREFAYGGYFNHFYVRTDHWSFVADNRGDKRELYDLTLDPAELHNVADANPDVHEELYARMLERTDGPLPYYQGEAVAPVKR